jgi:hypothetical protein
MPEPTFVHGGDEQPMDDQPVQTQEPAPMPEPTLAAPSALAPALVAQPPTTTQIALPATMPAPMETDTQIALPAPIPAPMETDSSGNQSTVADPSAVGTNPPFNLQPPTAMSITSHIRSFLTPAAPPPQPPPPPSTPQQTAVYTQMQSAQRTHSEANSVLSRLQTLAQQLPSMSNVDVHSVRPTAGGGSQGGTVRAGGRGSRGCVSRLGARDGAPFDGAAPGCLSCCQPRTGCCPAPPGDGGRGYGQGASDRRGLCTSKALPMRYCHQT